MGMSDPKIVHISGTARPSRRMLSMARALHGAKFATNVDAMLKDAMIVDKMAAMFDRALESAVTKDGRVDLRTAALHMIREMTTSQEIKPGKPDE